MQGSISTFLFIILHFSVFSQIVDIPDPRFKEKLIIEGVDTNGDGEIQILEAEAIEELDVRGPFSGSFSINSLDGIEAFVNLKILNCRYNRLKSLNIEKLTLLTEFQCSDNFLTSLNLENQTLLTNLWCHDNNLTALNLEKQSELIEIWCHDNNLTTLNLENQIELRELWCQNNNLTALNLEKQTQLTELRCSNNNLTELDLDKQTRLVLLWCFSNNLRALDLEKQTQLMALWCHDNSNLTSLNIKNGSSENILAFHGNPNLKYICADDDQQVDIQDLIEEANLTECVVNSYCSFNPGGEFYTLEGTTYFDIDASACQENPLALPHISFHIKNDNDNTEGTFISNNSGKYFIPLQEGRYTITPDFENANYFNITPENHTIDLPAGQDPVIQDFCISPNVVIKDVEISIIPLGVARPGFDADYKIIFKNKGTTAASGKIDFYYQSNYLSFVSADPEVDLQLNSSLQWEYMDLIPFEKREIYVTLKLNSPMDDPSLNNGDVLNFVAANYFDNDLRPIDNRFDLEQIVVNSYDPNDKRCLQGQSIPEELIGEYVHYMIRFENTGSAEAVNIVVKDNIDVSRFDISSLVVVESSHDMDTRIRDNTVEFIFENIYLPFDDDNNDGYLVFKIKTLPTLSIGDSFENQAAIYFDFNFPIITNKTKTEIKILSHSQNIEKTQATVSIHPNPTFDQLRISSDQLITQVKVLGLDGRLLQERRPQSLQCDLSLKGYTGLCWLKIETVEGVVMKKVLVVE